MQSLNYAGCFGVEVWWEWGSGEKKEEKTAVDQKIYKTTVNPISKNNPLVY